MNVIYFHFFWTLALVNQGAEECSHYRSTYRRNAVLMKNKSANEDIRLAILFGEKELAPYERRSPGADVSQ